MILKFFEKILSGSKVITENEFGFYLIKYHREILYKFLTKTAILPLLNKLYKISIKMHEIYSRIGSILFAIICIQ